MTQPGDREHRQQPPARPAAAMSPAEKLAAEWEARHDVAARGDHASPRAVQEYLAHVRASEGQIRPPVRAAPSQPAGRVDLPAAPRRQPSWLRRLGFGGRRPLG